jgi:hypothetical protein
VAGVEYSTISHIGPNPDITDFEIPPILGQETVPELMEQQRMETESHDRGVRAQVTCGWLLQWLDDIGGAQNCPGFEVAPSCRNEESSVENILNDVVFTWNGDSLKVAFFRTLTTDIFLNDDNTYGGRLSKPPEGFDWLRMISIMTRMLVGRRFMVSDDGYMALGPEEAQLGDCICLIPGSEVPLFLRPLCDGQYTLVGEIYVHGLMDGELWKFAEKKFAGRTLELQELKIL